MAQPNFGLLDNALVNKNRALEGYGAVNTLISQVQQNQADKMALENAMAEKAAYEQAGGDVVAAQKNLMRLGQGKQSVALGKAVAETEQAKMKALSERLPILRDMSKDMAFNPSDQNIQAHLQDQILKGWITPEEGRLRYERVANMSPEQRKEFFLMNATKAEDLLSTQLRGAEAQTARERLAFETSPTRQAQIAQAKSAGTETGKTAAKVAADLPGAIEAAERGIALIDEMVGKAPVVDASGKVIEKGTAPHAGFSSYVGGTIYPGARFIEGSDTASYELRQKQIEGQAFLEAFRTLKGGGSITEKEGEKATAAITRMNKAASEKEYIEAARELQSILRTGVKNAREKASRSVVPTTGGTAAANTPAASAYNQWLQQQQQ